ncbi:hypothetical protein [Paenibacillus illinoisensis]|uniref:DUF4367 domain-containing protein n=1 Tax=Paenibacillus illinoisensis TaxID=59845 RepID=A0A2W0C7E0_9BACL|nr:hypothetical protein [Paenibacillus illinoisensis]PYY27917.1 Uncharacterized protein PIL02S_04590 [Paenibacillus illinoisensis]
MDRNRNVHEYEDIKQACINENLPEINVTQQVMNRITVNKGRSHLFLKKTMRGTTALGGAFALILLVSVSAYAASEYIQLYNREGVVKVKHVALDETAAGTAVTYSPYAAQAQKFAQPGELIAYYVNSNSTSTSVEPRLHFEYKEQPIPSYSDFLKEIKRTGAPLLPESVMGYSFEYGKINPEFPTNDVYKKAPYYQEVYSDLRDQATKASSRETVFMRSVPWLEPSSISGVYSQGNAQFGISATLMNGENMVVEQKKENTTDKFTVAGIEIVYNSVKKESVGYHYLNWYNEEQDAFYTLTSTGDKNLTKEQLLKLAEELLK